MQRADETRGSSWSSRAVAKLMTFRDAEGAFPYHRDGSAGTEPTALAILALAAHGADANVLDASRRWLGEQQLADGSVPPRPGLRGPGWVTPWAMLAWHSVASTGGDVFADNEARAASWLLELRGHTFERSSDDVVAHDSTRVGWPWVADTYAWVEPTSAAVLALGRARRADERRVVEGVELLLDRFIPAGGWNYGNKRVFGTELRPRPVPTALALMALRGRSEPSSPEVARSCRYLEDSLVSIRSPHSLGLGTLALRAWGREPEAAQLWLREAAQRLDEDEASSPSWSYLLMATSERTLSLFGIEEPT